MIPKPTNPDVHIEEIQSADPSDTINNLFFASLAIFSFAYHGTWGPLAWDICGEM